MDEAWRRHGARAEQDDIDEFLLVDGQVDGLANLDAVQWGTLVVDLQQSAAKARSHSHLERSLIELRNLLGGQPPGDCLNFARAEPLERGVGILHDRKAELSHCWSTEKINGVCGQPI